MKVKLRELYDTKYFYKTFAIDLNYLFDSIYELRKDPYKSIHAVNDKVASIFEAAKSGAPIEFDLAGCKFTPDCISCVMQGLAKGIPFCDTADASRDVILVDDMKRLNIKTDSFVDMPDFVLGSSVKEYVASLDNTVTYRIPTKDRNLYFPLAFITQCCRPKVNIAPCGLSIDYIRFIGSNFTIKDLYPFDEFFYATKEGVRVVKVNAERKLYDQKLGTVSIPEALNVGALVPSVFGVEKTLQTPGFDLLFERCLNAIQAQGVAQKLTLEQFFG